MKKTFLALSLLIVFSQFLSAQNIENKLTEWAKINPIEKLYLHLDRESYFSGQTIWFKGYFMSGFMPSAKSSTLYVELLNDQSEIILRNIFTAYLGNTMGQLNLPAELETGTYQLRAYSPIMLNQPGFTFTKNISIYGDETKEKETAKEKRKARKKLDEQKDQLLFFSEGGNFITDILNIVAFKAIDKNGNPLNFEGEIRDNKDELISNIKSTHDGMGVFALIPLPGETYYATINGSSEKYALPQQTPNGVLFLVTNTAKGKQFKLQQQGNEPAFKPAYMIGQMENQVLFKQPLDENKKEINGIIESTNFFSGILQLTVFNKDGMPLAERITFVNNGDFTLPGEIKVDTLNTEPRKRNRFSIALKDTIVGNFSVSIADADYEVDDRLDNIYSWILLKSNIKGYVHNPAYYFTSNADSIKNAMELVMMTNGWTRFKWTDVAENKLSKPIHKDEGYITFSGTVNIEGSKKTLPDKEFIMLMSPADTSSKRKGLPTIIKTDAEGRFQLDSMIFYDKMKFLFSDVRGKKSRYITVKLDEDSLGRRFSLLPTDLPTNNLDTVQQEKMISGLSDYLASDGVTLANVTVKARQKSETDKLDEAYSSGIFAGGINSRIYDLRNEKFAGFDLFQYLQGRVAGLQVSGTPGQYTLQFRGEKVALFLDEFPSEADMISAIPISQIAMIKLMPNSIVTPGGGTALAIYQKKGADLMASIEAPTDIILYNGYNIVKEFYAPNYDLKPDKDKVDNRLTLNWLPNIYVTDVNPTIPITFYNNDRTKRFKVVVEGVTNDGRLLMIEKIIE